MTAPNRRIRIVAWAIIVTHAIGVVANGFGLFTGDPAYTPALWMTFMVLKALGVVQLTRNGCALAKPGPGPTKALLRIILS